MKRPASASLAAVLSCVLLLSMPSLAAAQPGDTPPTPSQSTSASSADAAGSEPVDATTSAPHGEPALESDAPAPASAEQPGTAASEHATTDPTTEIAVPEPVVTAAVEDIAVTMDQSATVLAIDSPVTVTATVDNLGDTSAPGLTLSFPGELSGKYDSFTIDVVSCTTRGELDACPATIVSRASTWWNAFEPYTFADFPARSGLTVVYRVGLTEPAWVGCRLEGDWPEYSLGLKVFDSAENPPLNSTYAEVVGRVDESALGELEECIENPYFYPRLTAQSATQGENPSAIVVLDIDSLWRFDIYIRHVITTDMSIVEEVWVDPLGCSDPRTEPLSDCAPYGIGPPQGQLSALTGWDGEPYFGWVDEDVDTTPFRSLRLVYRLSLVLREGVTCPSAGIPVQIEIRIGPPNSQPTAIIGHATVETILTCIQTASTETGVAAQDPAAAAGSTPGGSPTAAPRRNLAATGATTDGLPLGLLLLASGAALAAAGRRRSAWN